MRGSFNKHLTVKAHGLIFICKAFRKEQINTQLGELMLRLPSGYTLIT